MNNSGIYVINSAPENTETNKEIESTTDERNLAIAEKRGIFRSILRTEQNVRIYKQIYARSLTTLSRPVLEIPKVQIIKK